MTTSISMMDSGITEQKKTCDTQTDIMWVKSRNELPKNGHNEKIMYASILFCYRMRQGHPFQTMQDDLCLWPQILLQQSTQITYIAPMELFFTFFAKKIEAPFAHCVHARTWRVVTTTWRSTSRQQHKIVDLPNANTEIAKFSCWIVMEENDDKGGNVIRNTEMQSIKCGKFN